MAAYPPPPPMPPILQAAAALGVPPPQEADRASVLRAVAQLFHAEDGAARGAADRWLEAWQQTPGAWSVADALLHEPQSPMEAQHFCAQTLKAKAQRDFEELPPDAAASLRESLLQLLLRFSRGAPPVRTQLCLALAAIAAHLPAASWPAESAAERAAAAAGAASSSAASLLTSPPPGAAPPTPPPPGNVVRWFAHRFRNEPPEASLPCVLEMLTVLPQEVDAQAIALRPERRREFASELRAAVPDAFDVLGSCLSAPGDRVRSQALEAFAPWMRLASEAGMVGGAGAPLPAQALLSSPLVAAALDGLVGDESTFHAAVDAVCELVWATVDPATASPRPELAPLMARIAPTALALRPRFALAARRAAAEAAGRGDGGDGDLGADDWDDDEDTAKDMARLFAEVAEACIQPLASAAAQRQADAAAPIEAMLEVAGHPDPEIRSISFSFWHKLSRVVVTGSVDAWLQEDDGWGDGGGEGGGGGGGGTTGGGAGFGSPGGPGTPHHHQHPGHHHNHNHGGDGGSATTSGGGMLEAAGGGGGGGGPLSPNNNNGPAASAEERAARAEFLRPAFERLLRTVREAMRTPEMIDSWPRAERLEWRHERHDLGEVLLDAAQALGPRRALELLTQPLQEMSAGMSGAGGAGGSSSGGPAAAPFSWRTAELALACLRAAHRAAPPAGDPQLEALLAALPSLPGPHEPLSSPHLAETAALMVASYGGWLSRTLALGRGASLPGPLLGMLVRGLQHPVSATACAFGARHLAHDCGAHMSGCVAELMDLYSRALRCGAAAGVLGGGGAGTPRSPVGGAALPSPTGGVGACGPNAAAAAPLPISEEDVLQLLEAVVMAVTRSVSPEDLGQAVAALAGPVIEPLQAAVAALDRAAAEAAVAAHTGGGDAPLRQQAAQAEADAASAALLPLVDRLAALFQTVGAARPAVAADVLARAWPALELGLSRAAATANRSTAAERLCRALRHGVKASGKHCAPLLPSLLATLPSHFAATREPALLFVVSELVKAFGDDPAADGAVGPILAGLLAPTCAALSSPSALDAEPEMVDDVFLLAGRALNYAPRLALTPQLLPALVDVALLGVLVQHREACGSALAFLTRLFDPHLPATLTPEQLGLVQAQLARAGPPFMRLALAGVAGTLPAGLVSEVARCLASALAAMGGQGLRWFADAVAVIPDVAALPSDRDALARKAAALVSHCCGGSGQDAAAGAVGGGAFLVEPAAVAAAAATGAGAQQFRQAHRHLSRVFEGGVYELADLCRRNRRAQAESQRALLPLELHGLIFV